MYPNEPTDVPGENFVKESKAIKNILRDLAPELLDNSLILNLIYAYIFSAPDQPKPSFTQLRHWIDEALGLNSKPNLNILLSILKGALRFKTALGISSFPDFDQELHIRKEKILSELFDPETSSDSLPSTLHTGKNN